MGTDARAQPWAGDLDLAGVHNILHRNSEGAAWKRGHGILSTAPLVAADRPCVYRTAPLLLPGP